MIIKRIILIIIIITTINENNNNNNNNNGTFIVHINMWIINHIHLMASDTSVLQ